LSTYRKKIAKCLALGLEILFNKISMTKLVSFIFLLIAALFLIKSSSAFPANFISGSDTLENPKHIEPSVHTLVFTLSKTVPHDGDMLITIPAVDATGQGNNGVADTASTTQANGFDLNNLMASNVTISSNGCENNWGVGAITEGTATTDHKIRIYRVTDSCAAGATITVVIGDQSRKLLNPAPLSTPSADGKADIYTLHVRSRNGSGEKLDQLDVRVAIGGPVTISATVAETFSFTLAGVPNSSRICGIQTDIATTASSIPWGNIDKPFSFKNAAQLMTVSTNTKDGYVVTVAEDDQLKRKNFNCQGADLVPTSSCISDTRCDDGVCTESSGSNWNNPKTTGFGYSLENTVGKDATFSFNEKGGSFTSRQFADIEAGEKSAVVLSGNSPTTGSAAAVCYRISISDIQPAGYYTNHLLYTASPRF